MALLIKALQIVLLPRQTTSAKTSHRCGKYVHDYGPRQREVHSLFPQSRSPMEQQSKKTRENQQRDQCAFRDTEVSHCELLNSGVVVNYV